MRDFLNQSLFELPPDPYVTIRRSDLMAGNARYYEIEAENKRLKDLCAFQAEKINELAASMTDIAKVLSRLGEHT